MRRHGDGDGDGDAAHDVEMATAAAAIDKTDELQDAQPAGFHRSLGTTTSTKKPANPFLRDDSYKRITASPVPFGSLAEAFAYSVFLLLFILATCVVGQTPQAYYFANRVKAAITERDFAVTIQPAAAQKRFVGIQDTADVWAFLESPFLDAVYGTSLSDDEGTRMMMLSYNRVLGGVRFRALRVKPDTCPALTRIPEYAALVPFCYGRFTAAEEQTAGYGPILNSEGITAALAFQFAQRFFQDKAATKSYSDLQTCYTDCPRACGDHYGVDRNRYAAQCTLACGVHCKCLYEQPAGFTNLCPDPNPNGAGVAIPDAVYAYNWSSAVATGSPMVTGYTTAYPGSGYVVDLPLQGKVTAAAALAEMKRNRFLDLATRALVVEFTLYNAYLQLFNLVTLVVEFPAVGGVYAGFSDEVLDAFQYDTPRDTPRIVLELLLVTFIAWRWKVTLAKWYGMGVRVYLGYDPLWHGVECVHLAVFTAAVALRLYLIDRSYGTLSGSALNAASALPQLHGLARLREADAVLGSVNAACVWLQWLKYAQMSKRVLLLLRTLRRASHDLAWFFVFFLLGVGAFAHVGFLLFGLQLAQFRSLGVSVVTLLQAVAGDLELAGLTEAHAALGPVFYVAFYLLLLLIVLNVFLAIVNDAYVQTLGEQEEQDDAEERALDIGGGGGEEGTSSIEAQLARIARRDLEQLRKYPFSKGILPAMRLLVADWKRALYELRTGRKLFKVDPAVSGFRGAMGDGGGGGGGRGAGPASRKLTLQVKRQLERQMQVQEAAREAQREQREQAQQAAVESQQNELAMRLQTLVESNRDKTKRMEEMEGVLGSIEKLCQQLVTATMEDVPASSPKRQGTTAGGGARPLTGTTALSMALQRQKTARGSSKQGTGEGEIEEITL